MMKREFGLVLIVLLALSSFVVIFPVTIGVVWAKKIPAASSNFFSVSLPSANPFSIATVSNVTTRQAATGRAITSKGSQSSSNTKSWHIVDSWSFTLVTASLTPISFEDVLDRLHDAEDRVDDGSDDLHDRWREIKRRVEAIRNVKAILSKKIYRARRAIRKFVRTISFPTSCIGSTDPNRQ
jgi:hypothetical protein